MEKHDQTVLSFNAAVQAAAQDCIKMKTELLERKPAPTKEELKREMNEIDSAWKLKVRELTDEFLKIR